jgi:tetratricopeptide (TPR) repeat protein
MMPRVTLHVPAAEAPRNLTYAESVAYYRRALEELLEAPGEHRLRARLHLGLAESLRYCGDAVGAREAFLDAARQARSVGDVELLAQAAFGYGLGAGGLHRAIRCDLQQMALLEEGLAALGPGDRPLRARLLARLAEELYFSAEDTSRTALASEAVAMAKRLGDRHVLLAAEYARELSRVGPDLPLEERLQSTSDLIALAAELGESETLYLGHMLRELVLIESGRFDDALLELDSADRYSDSLKIPGLQAWVLSARARQAWLRGAFAQAEVLNAEAMARALEQGGDPEVANLVIGGQLLAHQLLRSELGQFVPALEAYRADYPHLLILPCFLAYAFVESGQAEQASAVLEDIKRHGVLTMPRTTEWSTVIWALAGVTAYLDDADLAALLYAELLPMSGRWFADWASTCLGPVDASLGLLATTKGSLDEACAHFERALEQARAAPSPPWLADAQVHYARTLLLRAGNGDLEHARALRDEALASCAELGMNALAVRARTLSNGHAWDR